MKFSKIEMFVKIVEIYVKLLKFGNNLKIYPKKLIILTCIQDINNFKTLFKGEFPSAFCHVLYHQIQPFSQILSLSSIKIEIPPQNNEFKHLVYWVNS